MEISRRPIRSSAFEGDERLWLDIAVTDAKGSIRIDAANIGGAALPEAEGKAHDVDSMIKTVLATPPRKGREALRVLIMMTLAHEVIAVWESEVSGDYLAHLGFYDVAADRLDMLEFVDDITGEKTQAGAIAVLEAHVTEELALLEAATIEAAQAEAVRVAASEAVSEP